MTEYLSIVKNFKKVDFNLWKIYNYLFLHGLN